MNLPLRIARRYLFSKKSHNAVNIISILSVFGIAVATMAMIGILSVFNGFTDVVTLTFSDFDPDLEITATKGKVFDPDSPEIQKVLSLKAVAFSAYTLEENALLRYDGRQEPIILRGLSIDFKYIADLEKYIIAGEFGTRQRDIDFGVVGVGVASKLGIYVNSLKPLEIYMPKRNIRFNPANPASSYVRKDAYMSGVFSLNQAKYDNQMVIVSIEMVRELLGYTNEVSSINIKAADKLSIGTLKKQITSALGDDYKVKDRTEQQASTYRMVNVEKWVTFLILTIIVVIAVFNIIGSLSMLILEKMGDIKVLKNLGARNNLICRIFLYEGWLITISGVIIGVVVGLTLCLIQQYLGIIKLGTNPGAFVIDAYPVSVRFWDVVITVITTLLIGLAAVVYPINNLRRKL